MPAPVIALLTDFGHSDPYAGIMKGVILSIHPEARLVDITHDVPPQAVSQGAFLLETAWRYFPTGTIFLVVVDPRVGSSRRRIAIQAGGMVYVGPDNGCLSAALPDSVRGERSSGAYIARKVTIDGSVAARSIENQALFQSTVSATFEGRDVFAPVAAFLAQGGSLEDVGPPIAELEAFPAFRAPKPDGKLAGLVIHLDTYGNVITDIRASDIGAANTFRAEGISVELVSTYVEAPEGEAVALIGSSGFVEIAVRDDSAARLLGMHVGDVVIES